MSFQITLGPRLTLHPYLQAFVVDAGEHCALADGEAEELTTTVMRPDVVGPPLRPGDEPVEVSPLGVQPLQPLGIAVTRADAAPKRPHDIEAAHPGAMQPLELHSVLAGIVVFAGLLFVAAARRAAFGAITGT